MNKLDKAAVELRQMDELAALRSPVHDLNPIAKLVTTVIFIVVVTSFDRFDLAGLVPMLLWPAALFALSGISPLTCFYKLRRVLPILLAVGLFNPLLDRRLAFMVMGVQVTWGIISMLTIMLKGVLALMASFLLIATTPVDRLCGALRRLRVPKDLVTLLLLTYRYAGTLLKEVGVMTDAYHLRAPGQRGIHFRAWGSFLGQLLLRTGDRAQALYASMRLRGFHGEFHYAEDQKCGAVDVVYMTACIALFIIFRFVPVAELLGRIVI